MSVPDAPAREEATSALECEPSQAEEVEGMQGEQEAEALRSESFTDDRSSLLLNPKKRRNVRLPPQQDISRSSCSGFFRSSLSFLRNSVSDQWSLTLVLLRHKCLRHLTVVVWLVTIGGNLQKPVISFFYLKLSMSAIEIGRVGFIVMLVVLLGSPVYGYLMDRRSAFLAVLLSLSMCGVGCFLRGIATDVNMVYLAAFILGLGSYSFETMALAALSRFASADFRFLIVSGFLLQIKLIAIVTRLIYPAWTYFVENAMKISDAMTRYRIAMGLCIAPCLVGFLWLLGQREKFVSLEREMGKMEQSSNEEASEEDPPNPQEQRNSFMDIFDTKRPSERDWSRFFLLSCILLFNSFTSTTLLTLWPLFVNFHFKWDDNQYSFMLLLSSLVSAVCLLLGPKFEESFGSLQTRMVVSVLGGFLSIISFSMQQNTTQSITIHVISTILLIGCCTFLDAAIQSAASLCLGISLHGRQFGILATFNGMGNILANLLSAFLYQASLDSEFGFGAGGALPLFIAGMLMLANVVLLVLAEMLKSPTAGDAVVSEQGDQRRVGNREKGIVFLRVEERTRSADQGL
mmetsp:Transcript_9546/g.31964  ORF Transcript_9546/g.31964 Transcript_9546/m.31964 type:complete len:574 (-) Transcript_9546:171-1892(-)